MPLLIEVVKNRIDDSLHAGHIDEEKIREAGRNRSRGDARKREKRRSLRSPRDFFIFITRAGARGDLSYKVPIMRMHSQEWLCHLVFSARAKRIKDKKNPRATHKERERALGYKLNIGRLAGLALGFVFGMAFLIEGHGGAD